MTTRVRLGMLTPSSNTTLEPVVAAMLTGLPDVSAHFSRFRVTEIALTAGALAQFDDRPILAAAELLAHAKVDAIAWNGTSSSWLGFDADQRLCERIEAATGIRACTSILAMNEVLGATGVTRFGLVTPYIDAVQDRIVANYARSGITCDAERHLGIQDNFAFAEVQEATLQAMIREVAARKPDAIGIICTNLRAARLIAALEAETAIPIYDSIATTVWKSLKLAGVATAPLGGWGSLFRRERHLWRQVRTLSVALRPDRDRHGSLTQQGRTQQHCCHGIDRAGLPCLHDHRAQHAVSHLDESV